MHKLLIKNLQIINNFTPKNYNIPQSKVLILYTKFTFVKFYVFTVLTLIYTTLSALYTVLTKFFVILRLLDTLCLFVCFATRYRQKTGTKYVKIHNKFKICYKIIDL